MLAHPRMVGRALDREIERHLDTERRGGADETAEIRKRAELRVDCAMAALRRTDRIGAARIAWLRNGAVVLAFAVDPADRMDRHEIDDIETEPRDLGKARDAIVEAGALAGHLSLAAREHLVPGGKARRFAVDDDFELARIANRVDAHRIAPHQFAQLSGDHQLGASRGVAAVEAPQHLPDPRRIVRPGLAQHRRDDRPAFDEFELDALAGFTLLLEFVAPAFELIGPCLDRVTPQSEPIEAEVGDPAIVVE